MPNTKYCVIKATQRNPLVSGEKKTRNGSAARVRQHVVGRPKNWSFYLFFELARTIKKCAVV